MFKVSTCPMLVVHPEQVEELVLLRVGHHGHLDGVAAGLRLVRWSKVSMCLK